MNILLVASVAATAVGAVFALTRQLHMSQQNSYYISRYLNWLKDQLSAKTVLSGLIFAVCILFVFLGWYIQLIILTSVFTVCRANYAFTKQKKAIKPLVFTARVKRQYVTAIIIMTALTVCCAVFDKAVQYFAAVVFLLSFAVPILAVIVLLINMPFEFAVRQWYISDAKRRLRRHEGMKIIGITGSYGKTSSKYILTRLLSEKYDVLCTPGNFNTTLGVVRTIREYLKPTTQIFVCEMGAKNIGDIKEICDIVHPDSGIITSIGPQHLQTFKSIDNVISAKFELADEVRKNGGKMYLNGDNEYIRKNAGKYDSVFYGTGDCEYRAENIKCSRFGTEFDVVFGETRISVNTKLLGSHNVVNVAGAVAVAAEMGVSARDIKYALSQIQPVEHRLQMKPFIKGSILIDDAYNSNPDGCLEAVRVLGSFDGLKKIIVTPGLVELEDKEYECNYNLGLAAGKTCDEIVLVGLKRARPMLDAIGTLADFDQSRVHTVASFKDAMTLLQTMVDENSVVLFENDLPDNYAK